MDSIFILRHAHAEDLSETLSSNDFDRVLTKEGKEKAKRLAKVLEKTGEPFEIILSSPYKRAIQTVEALIENLNIKPELKICDFLSCGASSKEIAKGLLPYINNKNILLVGHAPDLEIFLGKLIGAERVKLKKLALAKVKLNSSLELSGELEWLITPQIVKNLKPKEFERTIN